MDEPASMTARWGAGRDLSVAHAFAVGDAAFEASCADTAAALGAARPAAVVALYVVDFAPSCPCERAAAGRSGLCPGCEGEYLEVAAQRDWTTIAADHAAGIF